MLPKNGPATTTARNAIRTSSASSTVNPSLTPRLGRKLRPRFARLIASRERIAAPIAPEAE